MDDEKSIAQFKATGGPAFPAKWELPSGGNLSGPGMTLRDWFATHATERDIEKYRLLFWSESRQEHVQPSREAARYLFADAMLAERSKEAS